MTKQVDQMTQREMYKGKIIWLSLDKVELPNGTNCELEVIHHPGGSAVVAEATAKKELQEEAGVTASQWQSLGNIYSSPGVFTEVIHLYLAQSLSTVATSYESEEVIKIHWLPIQEACEWAVNGKLTDAKTIIGLLRAKQYIK